MQQLEQRLVTGSGMIVSPADTNMDNSCFGRFTDAYEQSIVARNTLGSILEASRAFAKVEGKKMIVLLTGEMPIPSMHVACPQYVSDVSRLQSETMQARDLLIREANPSNVNFYIVNTEGLSVPGWDASTSYGRYRQMMGSGIIPRDTSAMFWLANETGGRYFPGNFVDRSLKDLGSISSNFYSLGYSPAHPEDGPGYSLQHRDGYSNVTSELQLERALGSSIGVSMLHATIPMEMSSGPARENGAKFEVPIHLEFPIDRLQLVPLTDGFAGRVNVYISLFDAQGQNLEMKRYELQPSLPNEATAGRFRWSHDVSLRKGSYQIVVALHDQLSDGIAVSIGRLNL